MGDITIDVSNMPAGREVVCFIIFIAIIVIIVALFKRAVRVAVIGIIAAVVLAFFGFGIPGSPQEAASDVASIFTTVIMTLLNWIGRMLHMI